MYAIVEVGSRQYRVSPGEKFLVEKLAHPAGSSIELPVLLLSDESGVTVGTPHVEGKTLTVKVMGEVKGEKLIAFKYTPKKRYRRKTGHRQTYTLLQVPPEKSADVPQVEAASLTQPTEVAQPIVEPAAASVAEVDSVKATSTDEVSVGTTPNADNLATSAPAADASAAELPAPSDPTVKTNDTPGDN